MYYTVHTALRQRGGEVDGTLSGFNGIYIETSTQLDKLIPALILLVIVMYIRPQGLLGRR